MKYSTLLLVLVIAASGCIQSTNETPQKNSEPAETSQLQNITDSSNTIYFTENGFEPSDLTIEKGETVTWINNASTSMWVASDQHPRHTEYSGSSVIQHCQSGDQNTNAFDQCSSGDRFTFTFEKTGEWGYHNHESASYGGTIVVE